VKHGGSNQYSLPHSHINARQNRRKNQIDYIVTQEDYLAGKMAPELLEIEKLLNAPLFSPSLDEGNNEGEVLLCQNFPPF
jgi:hypothetical protein